MEKKSSKEKDLKMLRQMVEIRRFEEKAFQAYQMQKIGGFCHLYIGQEAVVAGSEAAIRPDDIMITAYRDHGHALVRGMSMDECMAELLGKATGCSKGMGGSMHYFSKEKGMYGGHAIVGGHLPLAAGIAFAAKYRGQDQVTLCYCGDGAINIGSFHEAMNLAQLWKLPVIYIVENNQYGMGTSVARACSVAKIVDRAKGYDMKGVVVDGMDARKVRDGLAKVVAEVRKTSAPCFVEIQTYRYRGHSMSDPQKYRTKEELEKYQKADPIIILKEALIKEGALTEDSYKEMDTKAKKDAAASLKFAEESPDSALEERFNYSLV